MKLVIEHLINFDELTPEQKNQLNIIKQNLQKTRDEANEVIRKIDEKLGT
jgi:hypothetical protein